MESILQHIGTAHLEEHVRRRSYLWGLTGDHGLPGRNDHGLCAEAHIVSETPEPNIGDVTPRLTGSGARTNEGIVACKSEGDGSDSHVRESEAIRDGIVGAYDVVAFKRGTNSVRELFRSIIAFGDIDDLSGTVMGHGKAGVTGLGRKDICDGGEFHATESDAHDIAHRVRESDGEVGGAVEVLISKATIDRHAGKTCLGGRE
jgi:hypothetical protein